MLQKNFDSLKGHYSDLSSKYNKMLIECSELQRTHKEIDAERNMFKDYLSDLSTASHRSNKKAIKDKEISNDDLAEPLPGYLKALVNAKKS